MVSVIIPTYNAASYLPALLGRLAEQTLAHELIVIDSSSRDNTQALLRERGIPFLSIPTREFNHGATRNLGLQQARYETVIYLTQDALPANPYTLERIAAVLDSRPDVAMAYGRQLPYPETHVFGAFARVINYPAESRIKTLADIPELGIRTCSCSNSFAAYRKTELLALGGFPSDTILGEDVTVAAQFILKGKGLAYCAEAEVFHSHDYTVVEEFRRYFDIGVFHHQQQQFLKPFTGAESQGVQYMINECRYLVKNGYLRLLPSQFIRLVAKYIGYRAGRHHSVFSTPIKKQLSMNPGYWISSGAF